MMHLGEDVGAGLCVVAGPALSVSCGLSHGERPDLGDSLGVAVGVGGGLGDLVVCMRAAAVSGRRMGDVGMQRASCMQQSGSYGREVHSRDPAPEQ